MYTHTYIYIINQALEDQHQISLVHQVPVRCEALEVFCSSSLFFHVSQAVSPPVPWGSSKGARVFGALGRDGRICTLVPWSSLVMAQVKRDNSMSYVDTGPKEKKWDTLPSVLLSWKNVNALTGVEFHILPF